MKKVLLLTTIGVVFSFLTQAQNVFNPNDLNRRHRDSTAFHNDSTKLYADPDPSIPGLQKWVSRRTSGIDSARWGKDYKAYYINVFGIQMSFRLKYPTSFQNPDSAGKKYPLALFFHGAGEPGCTTNGGVYNNELQLAHGGEHFRNLVVNNQFDGFLLYPQMTIGNATCWAQWGAAPFDPWYTAIWNMIDSLGKYSRADIDRVLVYGLSSGGGAAWSVTSAYPQRVAKAMPSAAATNATNYADFVHIPIWFASGGTDTNPSLSYASATYNAVKNAGADIRWTLYPTLGHSVWNSHWSYPNHFPTTLQYVDSPQSFAGYQSWVQNMQNAHKANPVVYFQRYEFCPNDPFTARIGITAGFYEYEWQRNGITIATRVNGVNTILDPNVINSYTGHEMVVDSFGTYRVRFRRTNTAAFSSWSLKPAVISPKASTITPPIAITGLKSKVLPAPDGSTTTPLNLPVGYSGYQWYRVSDNVLVSTTNTYNAPIGQYRARITEQFGCGSTFSPIFTVVNAAGNPKPDGAKNLAAFAVSTSQIQLDWNENPNSGENETGFEIYRSTTTGGPYTLIHITAPNVITYTDDALPDDSKFYYIVRAVGNFGAAESSNEANATTFVDNIAPTAPSNLLATCITRDKVNLAWTASTDNSTVPLVYDIYINGQKSYSTSQTKYYINELTAQQTYTFIVKARDGSGNNSQPSNQLVAQTRAQGLCYKVYQGDWDVLPDFNTLTPVKEGMTAGIDLSVRPAGVNDNFGFVWEGYLTPTATSTSFRLRTCSDDGSKVYFNIPYLHEGASTVNNDGLHGNGTCVNSSNQNVTANTPYRLTMTMFEKTGGEDMQLLFVNSGSSFNQVPTSMYTETYTGPGGTAPAAPTHLAAYATGHNKIELLWTDNSNNETGFEVTRSTTILGTFVPVATVTGASYTDSNVVANTPYYYKVRAVGAFGQSATVGVEADWQLNNSTADANGNASRGLTGTSTSFNAADKKEGSHSVSFNGTSSFLTVTNSTSGGFPSNGGFNKRSVGLWIKPTVVPTNAKIMWFEFGGPDNGMALKTTSTGAGDVPDLVAGIASGSTRDSIRLNDFTSNANWIAGGWNHVDVVYAAPSYRLLLNGVEVASKTLSGAFNTISANSGSTSRFGNPSTDNSFNDPQNTYGFFSGLMDDISINGMATTMPLPAAPAAPTTLTAQVVSMDNINLQWDDNSTNETGFEIWRSVGDNLDFRLLKTLNAIAGTGTRNYSDTALFANITYYYKVRAIGPGVPSTYTNEVNATTQNTAPIISTVLDYAMKYGTVYNLPISATDEDGDPLSFIFDNLPSFISIQNISNGNIEVVYSPTIGDQGAYTTTVIVSDGHNGYDTTFYTLVVNDNTVPILNNINNVVMNEGATFTVPLVANDAEGNNFMVWSWFDMPSFATFTDSGNGRGSIRFAPGYAASGIYSMTIFVDDGNGSWASRAFTITVNEVDPNESFQLSFRWFTSVFSPAWNNINLDPRPLNVGNLRNSKGVVTTVGINVVDNPTTPNEYFAGEAGVQTGNNSGVYSDTVMKDFMSFGFFGFSPDTVVLRVRNLDPAKRYNFTFFASTADNFGALDLNSTTKYRIGTAEAIVRPYLNSQETDTIYQVAPNASGEVFISAIGNAATSAGGLLNAMVIDGAIDDGTTPAKPLNLTGEFIENTGVRLQWVDRSYNEFSYRVYRATAPGGPYTWLNPGAKSKDSTTYIDATAVQFTTYYYYVAGNNNHGDGTGSDTVSVTTGNNMPVISGLVDLFVKTDATVNDDFTVTDHVSDVVTVSIANKPSFVTLTPLGGNNYRISVNPTFDNVGFYYLDVVAEDDKGGVSKRTVNITVSDKNVRSIYVNFGQVGVNAPAPWNNFLHFGGAGSAIANLRDEAGVTTTIGLSHGNAWGGVHNTGHLTGNNTGAYPDTVIRSGIWYDGTTARTITINGLDNSKRYNIVIFGSQNEGYDATARYTVSVGSQSDTLNARNNMNMTANINGLTPVGGAITLNLIKMSGNFQFLNAMVLEEYTDPNLILNPVNLYVEPRDRTSTVLTWSDRTDNEDAADGFQLQRATDSLFTAGLQTVSLARNTTTFTNTGLNPNTKYWYRVRAKKGGVFSDWSNRVKTITPNSRVYVNFNYVVQSAAAPWNNFEVLPNLGTQLNNLINYNSAPTGYNLEITLPFNGENNAGMPTSNMFGVPNQVTQSSYWIDNSQVSQMKLSGLNQTKRYRIGFIASSNWVGGDLTTTLTINGRRVYINAWQNTTKIVSIGDLVPDSNGELWLNFSTTAAAGNGYNSGLIIDSYDDVNGGGVLNAPNNNGLQPNVVFEEADARPSTVVAEELDARIYPNPFRDVVNIDFQNRAGTKTAVIEVFDVTGRLVMRQQYSSLPEGLNTIRLSTPHGKLETGIYMLTLKVDGKVVKTGKLVKAK